MTVKSVYNTLWHNIRTTLPPPPPPVSQQLFDNVYVSIDKLCCSFNRDFRLNFVWNLTYQFLINIRIIFFCYAELFFTCMRALYVLCFCLCNREFILRGGSMFTWRSLYIINYILYIYVVLPSGHSLCIQKMKQIAF